MDFPDTYFKGFGVLNETSNFIVSDAGKLTRFKKLVNTLVPTPFIAQEKK